VFAFVCYVSIHLEISAMMVRSASEELPNRRKPTIADTTSLSVLTAIAAAARMRLMRLDLLFVAKRLAFLSDENRLSWFCRDKEVRAKRGLM
jgi:ParB family transcriptional regulator, chromosome partitioning protein